MIARGSSIDIRIIIRRWYALQCRQAVRLWHDDVGMTSQLGHTNITYILRVSYVYPTYILRISYVYVPYILRKRWLSSGSYYAGGDAHKLTGQALFDNFTI